jgi:hypothetical protein
VHSSLFWSLASSPVQLGGPAKTGLRPNTQNRGAVPHGDRQRSPAKSDEPESRGSGGQHLVQYGCRQIDWRHWGWDWLTGEAPPWRHGLGGGRRRWWVRQRVGGTGGEVGE